MQAAYQRINTWFVGLYKFAGFLLLSLIVAGMGFYLSVSGFYLLNRSWMVPLILSPSSEKVALARLHLLDQEVQLGKLQAEFTAMKSEHEYIRFAAAAHSSYQSNFLRAMDGEKQRTKRDLERTRALAQSFRALSQSSQPVLETYQNKAASELTSQFERRLIDKAELLRGQVMLTQISLARLNQSERLSELQSRSENLQKNLEGIGHGPATKSLHPETEAAAVPLEVIVKEQPLLQSLVASAELRSRIEPLEQRMRGMQKILDEYSQTVASMRQTPLVRAAANGMTTAFVPYENLYHAAPGTKVTTCYLEFILCHAVGEVVQVIEAEHMGRHPVSGRDLRGQLVELRLDDPQSARNRSLILGRAPLLL